MFLRRLKPSARLLWLAVLLTGCEPASFTPPPDSSDLTLSLPAASSSTTDRTGGIVLILPHGDSPRLRLLEKEARTEAGNAHVLLEVKRPGRADPESRQAELIREASHSASALIVVAEDSPTVAKALSEVRDRGLPVVLLGRAVAVEGKPLHHVAMTPYAESARLLATTLAEHAKSAGFSPEAPALILINGETDDETEPRALAIEAALKEAGIPHVERVKFGLGVDQPLVADAQKSLKEVANREPPVALIVADDDMGLNGAIHSRTDLGTPKGEYLLAGYAIDPRQVRLVNMEECSAVVDMNIKGMAHQAVKSAIRLNKGEILPDEIVVASPNRVAPHPRPPGLSPPR
jgi:ABC-type sugar transport system substrate-binding protein